MYWLSSSLNRKFALGTAGGLLVSSLVFLLLYIGMYRSELAAERSKAAAQVSGLLQTSLENAMLKRDIEGLRFIVKHLGEQPGIVGVFITNPAGEVRFASRSELLGTRLTVESGQARATAEFIETAEGNKVLRSVTPVANRNACRECHGPADLHPVNGLLYVDYDAASIRRQAQDTTLLLMGSGALIVLLNLLGGWWFIRRYVIKPIDQLTVASRRLASGDLAGRAGMPGQDELAQLGGAFDHMAGQLQGKIEELQHQREFLQQLVDAIPDGVRVIAPDYRVMLTNIAYRQQQQLDGTSGVGEPCYRATHRVESPCPTNLVTCPLHEIGKSGEPVKALHRHLRNDGKALDVEIYAAPMQAMADGRRTTLVVESIRDLSKQIDYSLEHELSELGKLATGVAHEIHNPLASIRLALHSLRSDADDGMGNLEIREYLELVDREVDKCIAVTDRLLRLGMTPPDTPELVEIAAVIEETLSLVRWEAEQRNIRLITDLQPGLRLLASDSQLRMVALNLIQNAIHAMPQGGRLTISGAVQHERIQLRFSDTGLGIPPDQLPRIFDPFFSRRADGSRGTGLGLPIARHIIEASGGTIQVTSTPGEGTTFVVELPLASSHFEESR